MKNMKPEKLNNNLSACFSHIERAIEDFRQGRFVIVVDDEGRENEGDFIIAAEKISPEAINFLAHHGRGLICLALDNSIIDRLQLPMMTKQNTAKFGTAFTVSIGAKQGITTGISAHDRAHTVRVAINENSGPDDISVPGHIFPLKATSGGVLSRAGHTEAGVDLANLAGFSSAAVLCEIMNEDGSMARRDDLLKVAERHGLAVITIADLIAYRIMNEKLVREIAAAALPIKSRGDFSIKVFENVVDNAEHIALVRGDLTENLEQPCLVRIHSQCLTGDVFGSSRCDCGWQLEYSLKKISEEGGVLLYMSQEGRGIGLVNKVKAYALQDAGMDTVEANHSLGFEADSRDYGISAQILQYLGVKKIRLLTNNPKKIEGIQRYGIEVVARETIEMEPTENNLEYLRTKRKKLGHLLSLIG